jgi:ribose transport system ATP-binding protein
MIYSILDAIVNNTPVLKSEIYTVVTVCKGISFSVLPGEVVGITGLGGSGRTEMAKLIFKMPIKEIRNNSKWKSD